MSKDGEALGSAAFGAALLWTSDSPSAGASPLSSYRPPDAGDARAAASPAMKNFWSMTVLLILSSGFPDGDGDAKLRLSGERAIFSDVHKACTCGR